MCFKRVFSLPGGKTTLLRVLLGELPVMGGTVWTHPSLRIAHVGQHHTEALQDYLHLTATQ
jgi:ATPase subunit of ABC transporter with duplicated ATPase domains